MLAGFKGLLNPSFSITANENICMHQWVSESNGCMIRMYFLRRDHLEVDCILFEECYVTHNLGRERSYIR